MPERKQFMLIEMQSEYRKMLKRANQTYTIIRKNYKDDNCLKAPPGVNYN